MDADEIALLRAAAKSTGGDWIGLSEPGEWFAGTVSDPAHQTVTTDFGETEELLVDNPNINDQQHQGTMTFRLSRSVLSAELGSGAENAPKPGWSVYVTYKGQRTGKSGRQYHAYDIAAQPPADPKAVAKKAKAKLEQLGAKADEDIPF